MIDAPCSPFTSDCQRFRPPTASQSHHRFGHSGWRSGWWWAAWRGGGGHSWQQRPPRSSRRGQARGGAGGTRWVCVERPGRFHLRVRAAEVNTLCICWRGLRSFSLGGGLSRINTMCAQQASSPGCGVSALARQDSTHTPLTFPCYGTTVVTTTVATTRLDPLGILDISRQFPMAVFAGRLRRCLALVVLDGAVGATLQEEAYDGFVALECLRPWRTGRQAGRDDRRRRQRIQKQIAAGNQHMSGEGSGLVSTAGHWLLARCGNPS
jgi:hypothetical protein